MVFSTDFSKAVLMELWTVYLSVQKSVQTMAATKELLKVVTREFQKVATKVILKVEKIEFQKVEMMVPKMVVS